MSVRVSGSRSHRSQDDNNFMWSTSEPKPTRRSLVGRWWADHWEAIKAIRCRRDTGQDKVSRRLRLCSYFASNKRFDARLGLVNSGFVVHVMSMVHGWLLRLVFIGIDRLAVKMQGEKTTKVANESKP